MKKVLLMICMMAASVTGVYAQRSDRSFIRKGNRMFEDSLFIKAEENYLKAVDMRCRTQFDRHVCRSTCR